MWKRNLGIQIIEVEYTIGWKLKGNLWNIKYLLMILGSCDFFSSSNFSLLQNQYKADYADFMKGIGWLPLGSLEAEKNKKAMEIISEKKYRQHPDTLKYSTLMDSMNMVLAKNNAKIMNEVSLSIM